MDPTLALAKQLISQESITPNDASCQAIIAARLKALGFQIETLPFGEVKNLWARYGTQTPLLVFAGHTDVVPPGPLEKWQSPPFEPNIRNGFLYGRGAADMKGGLAAMITACENFIAAYPTFSGSIAFLITSDEEGPSVDGTAKVVEWLQQRHEKIDYCIIGEASSQHQLGDMLKIGRRGSLSGTLTVEGIQGHIAYPHAASNPIHLALPALNELTQTTWDQGNAYFQPTCLQISNLHAGTGANNVIPGTCHIHFNFRYASNTTAAELQQRTTEILKQHQLTFSLAWRHSGKPFLSRQGKLVEAAQQAIFACCDLHPELSTSGGTSDGRFIAQLGCELLELGPVNKTIHQIDECIEIASLTRLTQIYQRILEGLMKQKNITM